MSAFSFAQEASASNSSSSSRRMPRLPGTNRSASSREAQPSLLPLPRATQPSLSAASATAPPASNTGLADWNPFSSPPRPHNSSSTNINNNSSSSGHSHRHSVGGNGNPSTSWGAFGFTQENTSPNRSRNWSAGNSASYNPGFSFAPLVPQTLSPPLIGHHSNAESANQTLLGCACDTFSGMPVRLIRPRLLVQTPAALLNREPLYNALQSWAPSKEAHF